MEYTRRPLIYLALAACLWQACGSAKNLYEQGDYYEAVIKSAKKLRKNPDHKKTREALKRAYPLAVEELLGEIRNLAVANPIFQNTQSVHRYEKLNKMHEQIKKSPGALKMIPNPTSYYRQLSEVKLAAAEEQYGQGIKELSVGYRQNAKKAYAFFQMANKFDPGYRDVNTKVKEAYQAAILHVVVNQVPVRSRAYELSGNLFYENTEDIFRRIESNEFIRFYSEQEARRSGISRPHHVLTLEFVDFVVGETHTAERVEVFERDSVVVRTVVRRDGSSRDVYNTVSAKLTTRRMEVISGGILQVNIQDEISGRSLNRRDLPGEFVWFNEWANFNGDKRALDDAQLALCENRMVMPPPPQRLFAEFTRPIYSQLQSYLVRFYDNY